MSAADAFDALDGPEPEPEATERAAGRTGRVAAGAAGIAVLWAALAVGVYLEVALAIDGRVLGAVPDLALVAVVAIALRQGAVGGAAAGFVAGLLLDVAVQGPLGVSSLVLTPLGWGAGWWAERRRRVSLGMATTVLLVATAASVAGDALAMTALEGQRIAWSGLVPLAAAEVALTVLVGIPVLALLRRVAGVPTRGRA